MAIRCRSVVCLGISVAVLAGCKSIQSRISAKSPANSEAVAEQTPTQEATSLGLTSLEQSAADLNSTAWGRKPYHFGRGNESVSASWGDTSGAAARRN